MLSDRKMKIMIRAVQIRMNNGEELKDILDSYAKLTDEDKGAIRKAVSND